MSPNQYRYWLCFKDKVASLPLLGGAHPSIPENKRDRDLTNDSKKSLL